MFKAFNSLLEEKPAEPKEIDSAFEKKMNSRYKLSGMAL